MTQSGTPQGPVPEVDQDALWADPGPEVADDGADAGGTGATAQAATDSREPRAGRSGAWPQALATRTAAPGPAGLWFAEVPDRIIAFILDVIALCVVGLVLAIVIGGALGGLTSGGATVGGSLEGPQGDLNMGAFIVIGGVALAISFAYFAYSWVVLRSTPGMRMLGLRIGQQRDGRPISWDQALIRWLLLGIAATLLTFAVYVPSLVGLVLALAGLAWLLVLLLSVSRSATNQGLHDRYAGTIVVRAPRRVA